MRTIKMTNYPETVEVRRVDNFPYIELKLSDFRKSVAKNNPTVIYRGPLAGKTVFFYIHDGIVTSYELPTHYKIFRTYKGYCEANDRIPNGNTGFNDMLNITIV